MVNPIEVSVFSALPTSLSLTGLITYILLVRGASYVELPYLL
jgi:hypothetical protein